VKPSFAFDDPDHFTAGTVGPPGQRAFYLQARQDGEVVTLLLEKAQVAALAEYLAGMLADLPPVAGETAPGGTGLLEPVSEDWRVGALEVAFDDAADRIVVVAVEAVPVEDPDQVVPTDEPARARFQLSRAQVARFIPHAQALMGQGRPPCPLCGRPMDPEGHVCPRSNGHRVTG
jgi:uncharacterized repeat protein (TIGR03847 family)